MIIIIELGAHFIVIREQQRSQYRLACGGTGSGARCCPEGFLAAAELEGDS